MTTREIIKELEKQKEMIGNGFFDQELLEKYLTLSASHNQEPKENRVDISVHGIGDLNYINNQLEKIYPYTTVKPSFTKARGKWYTLYAIARKTDVPVTISIKQTADKQYQKTPIYKQETTKAA